jgi:hypothetical protein
MKRKLLLKFVVCACNHLTKHLRDNLEAYSSERLSKLSTDVVGGYNSIAITIYRRENYSLISIDNLEIYQCVAHPLSLTSMTIYHKSPDSLRFFNILPPYIYMEIGTNKNSYSPILKMIFLERISYKELIIMYSPNYTSIIEVYPTTRYHTFLILCVMRDVLKIPINNRRL